MSKPKIYVIRPHTQWNVVELVEGREDHIIALCESEKQAMTELESLLREEAGDD